MMTTEKNRVIPTIMNDRKNPKYPQKMRILRTFALGIVALTSIGQSATAQVTAVSNITANVCAAVYNNDVRFMGRTGGLTATIPAGCAGTAYGFDINNAINFSFTPAVAPLAYDPCQSNLARGIVAFTGIRNVGYTNTSNNNTSANVAVRCIVTFTSGGSPIPLGRNGDIIYRTMMGSPYTVNYTLTAYTNDLVYPLWPHAEQDGGTTHNLTNTGWQPALRVFDCLSTIGAGGSVWTGLNAGFYRIGSFTMLPLTGTPPITPTGVTRTQAPASVTLPNPPGGTNTGIEISAQNGATGLTYTFANTTGQAVAIGFDPATAFGYSYENPGGPPESDVFNNTGRILSFMTAGSTPLSNLAAGLAVFNGCTPLRYRNTSYLEVTSTLTTQLEVRFMNASNATVPVTWHNGIMYMTVNNGASGKINLRMYVQTTDLQSPAWIHGTNPGGGFQPALTVFDRLATPDDGCTPYPLPAPWTGSSAFCRAHQKAEFKFFHPATENPGTIMTWTGAVSTAWQNPCNWNCRIPTIEDDVTIPASGVPNWPTIANYAGECRTIDVQGTTPANGLIIDGANSGTLQADF